MVFLCNMQMLLEPLLIFIRGVHSHSVLHKNFRREKRIQQGKRLVELKATKHLQTPRFATPITC